MYMEQLVITILFSRLVGDVLLASAFLSYSGPFNQEFRSVLLESWKKELKSRAIPFSSELNINEMLSDPVTVSVSTYIKMSLVLCWLRVYIQYLLHFVHIKYVPIHIGG